MNNMIKKILFLAELLILLLIVVLFSSCQRNPYIYQTQYYSIQQANQLFKIYYDVINDVKDILLKNEQLFNSREDNTSTITIYDINLKQIKKYFNDQEFDKLTDLFEKTGISAVSRRYDVVYYTFCLNDNEQRYNSYTIYYIPNNVHLIYYSQHYTEFKELSSNWYYGLK